MQRWITAALATVLVGAFAAPVVRGEITRVSIEIPDALSVEFGSPPQRTVRLELFLNGKVVEAVLVLPTARNPALAGWSTRDVESSLAFKNGRIEGTIEAKIIAVGRDDESPWRCILGATWKDGALTGRAESVMGNVSMSGHEFSVSPPRLAAMKGADGFLELHIPGVEKDTAIRAGIEFRDGKAVAAASFSALIHPVWRRLDASALTLKRGRLSGKLTWPAVEADDDVPASGAREMELNMDLRDGFAPVDPKKHAGVAILSTVPPLPETAEVELAFDGPLVGGERWRRRAVARLDVSRGAAVTSAFLNGRAEPGWSGVAETLSLERKPGRFDGALEATVASETVQPGVYGIRFMGEIIGPWIVGTFESDLAGAEAAKGDFTGWFAGAGR